MIKFETRRKEGRIEFRHRFEKSGCLWSNWKDLCAAPNTMRAGNVTWDFDGGTIYVDDRPEAPSYQEQIDDMGNVIGTVIDRDAETREMIRSLDTHLADTDAEVSDLIGDVESLRADVASTNAEVSTLVCAISDLHAMVSKNCMRCESLSSMVDGLIKINREDKQQIVNLELRVKELESPRRAL